MFSWLYGKGLSTISFVYFNVRWCLYFFWCLRAYFVKLFRLPRANPLKNSPLSLAARYMTFTYGLLRYYFDRLTQKQDYKHQFVRLTLLHCQNHDGNCLSEELWDNYLLREFSVASQWDPNLQYYRRLIHRLVLSEFTSFLTSMGVLLTIIKDGICIFSFHWWYIVL